ncbi:MAG: hypothetical protein Fur0015_04940 [Ignavibacteriales bacterium]
MAQKNLNKIFGLIVFVISLATYFLTVQPSVSFWDCGEFIASSYLMQVPHPPGTPFFLMLGRVFSLIPFADNLALRVNSISVISSAFTILFLYLIAVKLIENFRGKKYESTFDMFLTYSAAAIGALSFAFSDTFWFNAVEAEVYALSTFFIAFITYLIILWNEKADEPDNEKYIIMIAYLIGISTGVHLMSVLGLVPIVMVIVFRKYVTDEEHLRKTGILFLIHSVLAVIIALAMWAGETNAYPPQPEEYHAFDQRFVLLIGVVSLIFMGSLWKKLFTRNSFYPPILIGGLALGIVYPGIVKYFPKVIYEISGDSYWGNVIAVIAILGVLIFLIYWSDKNEKHTLHLVLKSLLFTLIGYSSYAMIMIRSNQETPINLNSPKTMSEMFSYVNREQYGDFPNFKRRFSQESHQQEIYTRYTSDLDFLISYQMNHMFNRYLLWNYVGRVSTDQDAGVDFADLFAIPFLLGLLGLYYHFRKDWKMASIFLVMFIFLGYLTAFYQNQQEPQPRERDYFYVGAFFVFSIWIALGVRYVFDLIGEYVKKPGFNKNVKIAAMILFVIFVPLNMLRANYFEHDRSRNFVPWDYAYNLLQSVEPNAILFTNGDNDTFPLWYLQDVEGVRQDVRIANLSLLNTPWYIKQLKNNSPHGAMKVKMTLSDSQIDNMGPERWETKKVSVPITREIYKKFNVPDSVIKNENEFSWNMKPTAQFGDVQAVRIQDLAVLDLIKANKWERPIYFAVTCADNSKLDLDDYLQMEGLALKLVPYKGENNFYFVNEKILKQQLFNEPSGFSKNYQPGFKYRGLNDSTIFLDENHQRLAQNYRNSYLRLAIYYLQEKNDKKAAIAVLDKMEEKLPRTIIPIRYELLHDVSSLYKSAGEMQKYNQLTNEVEKIAIDMIKKNPLDFNREYNPYVILKEIYENRGDYDKLIDLFTKLQSNLPSPDQGIKGLIEEYRRKLSQGSEVNKPVLPIK